MTSVDGSKRLAVMSGITTGPADSSIPPDIVVDAAQRFQPITGFGAAITDASAWLIQTRMNEAARAEFLEEMFDRENGLGLSLTRVTIGASDFSQSHYTYADTPSMPRADIDPARAHLIPTLKAMRGINPDIRIIASPWSAPAWMKDSGSLIKGRLSRDRFRDFARYLVSYGRAMRKAGVQIDMLTLQNEPHFEPADYPGMRVEPQERAAFIADELGPMMRKRLPGVKLLDWDHNWDEPESPLAVLADARANSFVDGIAWHCYGGDVSAQSLVQRQHPAKETWFTECSAGGWSGDWAKAFGWTVSQLVIGTTRNWARGVLMWNLVLDENAGPHLGGCGNCRGLVTLDTVTGELTREPEYFAFAHASRFVRPGAVRIASESADKDVEHVAFQQGESGEIVLIVRNAGQEPRSLRIVQGARAIVADLPAGAVATLSWEGP
ncbi:MAG: hypothetical protein A3J40_00125 [Erythrobacter sp. RIFCSPHIGHO2_12_FULL_63_10]|nr:MAG: hypothetical protein A3J40_00125 [Erythrobacter sp. RIFCSPHIGHO2_12_FULL_63_10]